ncbi:MAG: cation:proton antiporter [Gammaproteobacteria bacterium]|nr:cation:proton antiporter [Gammaproteobacteria bacterium]
MLFFPQFPLRLNPIALFGLTLILGLIGGELAKRSRILPAITGFIAVGFLVGPGGLDIVTPSLLAYARLFVDISLGLVLFDLGRHLDFNWLRHDRGILPMAIAESSLTFLFIFMVLSFFNLPPLSSALAATIAVATSPAEVMMVAHDLSAEGPVTRRTLILTSLNNLFGLTLFAFFLPFTAPHTSLLNMIGHVIYRLVGSVSLGLIMFVLILGIARFIGKRKENQFVLFAGTVVFAIGLTSILNVSSMLTLFTLGVAARNFDYKHILSEVDFGWLARLFFIILFVVTGVQLQLKGLWLVPAAVIAFLIARAVAKTFGIMLFAKKSRLTKQQMFALSLALTPMATLAIGMSGILQNVNPELSSQLIVIITAVATIFNLIGPVAAQWSFIYAGEAATEKTGGNK